MKALAVIGSMNSERKYSIASGERVAAALARKGWDVEKIDLADLDRVHQKLFKRDFDIVVPVGFGPFSAEDGTVWTMSSTHGIPCAGPTPSTGTLCTDKSIYSFFISGLFANDPQVSVPRDVLVLNETCYDRAKQELLGWSENTHIIIKPSLGGSSENMAVFKDASDAISEAVKLSKYAGPILVQELIQDSREFTICTVNVKDRVISLPIIELDHKGATFMGVDEKFGSDSHQHHVVNPPLTSQLKLKLEEVALKTHTASYGRGVQRMDVLVKPSNEIVVLETNPLAGMLSCSLAVDAAKAAGMSFDDLAEAYAATAFDSIPPTLVAGGGNDFLTNINSGAL